MKIAIYAISKNEIKHVDRFMDSIPKGVPVFVLDHSTDGTTERLRARGAVVDTTPLLVKPFRFDGGKNAALSLVPKDFDWVLNVDLDEVVSPNALDIFSLIEPDATLVRHLYRPDGATDRIRHECRLHRRDAYKWKLPIHERLHCVYVTGEKIQAIDDLLLTQFPDRDRRHTWCDRLLAAVKDYPNEPRLRMLCGRDLFFDGRYHEALEQFGVFLKLSRANPFDESFVLSMEAKCYKKLGKKKDEIESLIDSVTVAQRRESFVDLAHAYMLRGRYLDSLHWCNKALEITEGRYAPENDPGAWSFKPLEIKSHALYNLGTFDAAELACEQALALATGEDARRIEKNLLTMRTPL